MPLENILHNCVGKIKTTTNHQFAEIGAKARLFGTSI